MPSAEWRPVVVVVLDPGGDRLPGLGAGGEELQAAQFELRRGVPALDGRVVQGRADPAHRLRDADPLTRRATRARGVLTALVAEEITPLIACPPPRTATAMASAS